VEAGRSEIEVRAIVMHHPVVERQEGAMGRWRQVEAVREREREREKETEREKGAEPILLSGTHS
jgi:hypothetical protein